MHTQLMTGKEALREEGACGGGSWTTLLYRCMVTMMK
jgi:hypothetical protein